jgi:hypothetical protein
VRLIDLCLQMQISDEDIDEIEKGFAEWVLEYER